MKSVNIHSVGGKQGRNWVCMRFYILINLTSYCLCLIKQTWKLISSRRPVGLLGWTCWVTDSCVCLKLHLCKNGRELSTTHCIQAHSVPTVLQPNTHQQPYELASPLEQSEWTVQQTENWLWTVQVTCREDRRTWLVETQSVSCVLFSSGPTSENPPGHVI